MSDVERCHAGCIDDFLKDGKCQPPTIQELRESYIKGIFKRPDPIVKPVREERLPNSDTDETDDEDEHPASASPAKVEQEPTFEGVVPAAPESDFTPGGLHDGKLYSDDLFRSSSDEEEEEDSGSEKENGDGPSPSAGRPSAAELFKTAVAEKARTDTGKPVMDMQPGGVKPPSPAIAPVQPTGKKMEEVQSSSVEAAKEHKPKNVRTSMTMDELMTECETSGCWGAREQLRKIRTLYKLTGFEPKIERVEGKIYGCVATARAKGASGGLEASIETEEMYGDTPAEAIEAAVETLTDLIKSQDY